MTSRWRRGTRRWAALAVLLPVLVALGVSGLAGVAGSQEDKPLAPTEDGVGGFDMRSQSAPLLLNIDTPTLALPRLAQLGIPYATTTALSGPSGSAIGSVLWPGPVVADLGGALAQLGLPLPVPAYPIRAQAEYPTENPVVVQPLPGVRMASEATDDGFHAEATYPGLDLGGLVTVGSMSAYSDSTFEEGVVRTIARSEVARVELLDGMISIGGLVSRAEAASNGREGRASASLSPLEVTVAGQPAAFGAGGEGFVIPGRENATTALNRFLELLGLEVRLMQNDTHVDDQGTATADVSALFVRFAPSLIGEGTAGSFQRQLTSLLAQLFGTLRLPEQLGNFVNVAISLVAADYRISLSIGSSSAAALASPGFGGFDSGPVGDVGGGSFETAPFDPGPIGDIGGGSFDPPSLTPGGEVPLTPSVVDGGTPSSGGGESFAPFDTTSAADTAVPAGALLAALLAAPAFAGLARRFGMFALSPPAASCPLEKSPKEL